MSTTVLIVDDHAGFRARVRALLESEGYAIVGEAGDGETAFRRVRELAPEVVLLDVHLPDMDGFEVAERLSGENLPTRVVLTSSRDREDFGGRIATSTVLGFIPKADLSGAGLRELLG